MSPAQIKQIKEKIIQDILSAEHEISELTEKTKPITPDCSLGRLTRLEMIGEQQVNAHAKHESEIRLNKLKYALQKVDKDNYGVCLECEEEILFQRLMIVPESTHCMACASELNI